MEGLIFGIFFGVWKLSERHLLNDLPLKYVFYFLGCYQSDCVYPLCKKGKPDEELSRFPGGLPLKYIPVLTPDPERPFGKPSNSQSEEFCSVYYIIILSLKNSGNTFVMEVL